MIQLHATEALVCLLLARPAASLEAAVPVCLSVQTVLKRWLYWIVASVVDPIPLCLTEVTAASVTVRATLPLY